MDNVISNNQYHFDIDFYQSQIVESNFATSDIDDKNLFNSEMLDSQWNEEKEGNFELLMKKQVDLKCYYENYPDIDQILNKCEKDYNQAKSFTESILRKKVNGDLKDKTTFCHLLTNIFEKANVQCLFYDSNRGKSLHDISENLTDLEIEDKPFVLKLKTNEGLGNSVQPTTDYGQMRLIQRLNKLIELNQSNSIIDDISRRLSNIHQIDQKQIRIKTFYLGTFNIVYIIKDLNQNLIKSFTNLIEKYSNEFDQYLNMKIHPLLYRPTFDLAFFDQKTNKIFLEKCETSEIDAFGKTFKYNQPSGWIKYSFQNSDKSNHRNNWFRAFYGINPSQTIDFSKSTQSFDQQCSSLSINSTYGFGFYCSPDATLIENQYLTPIQLDTQKGKKLFKCILQVLVNPNGLTFINENNLWFVQNPQDIRPYGLIVKQDNSS